MDADFREDPFESLNDEESVIPREIFRIPSDLVGSKDAQRQEIPSILTFKYDISRLYFDYIERQEVKSLFFDLQIKHNELEVLENFIIIRFSEEREGETVLRRDRTVETLLREGVEFKNKTYNIVGCSNSQVQKKSFVFMNGTREQCDAAVERYIPNLDELKSKGVAKRVKYTGLLFTGCQYIIKLPTCVVKRVNDVKIGSFNFTDGCGLISMKLAEEIVKQNTDLQKKWKNGIPSVWQIRFYDGVYLCKGVLVLDYKNTTTSVLTLRDSLIKNSNTEGRKRKKRLGIVDTSLNPKIGKLNKQIITLLSESVDKDILLGKQKKYLNKILETRNKALEAVKSAALMHQWPIYKKLLRKRALEGFLPKEYTRLVQNVEQTFISTWHKGQGDTDEIKDRIQIPLTSSRLLFGAAYPEALGKELQEGQCVVCTESGIHEGSVIVSRSPSYSPGDIRVLKAIKPKQSNSPVLRMRNVIFFATHGKRPDPDKMSGGDLDGDKYLVIWDKELLSFAASIEAEEPMSYLHSSEGTPPKEDWFSYVAKWENSILAQVDKCFYYLAGKYGVKSKECKDLCKIFSRAVDQVSSDLKALKQISSKCSVPTKYKSFIHIPADRKPVWEVMIDITVDALECLNKNREKFPSTKEWEEFYISLVHLDDADVLDALRSSDVVECLINKNEVDQVKEFWSRICKGRLIQAPVQDILPTCLYNCEAKGCSKSHSIEPTFYSKKWRAKMHTEIMNVIQKAKKEKEDAYTDIKQHEDLRKKMVQMNSEAEAVYIVERKKIEINKIPIKQIWKTFSQVMQYYKLLEIARGKIKEPTLWQNMKSKFRFVRKLSAEENEALKDIPRYEKQLTKLYNQLQNEANGLSLNFGLPGILYVTFETLPERDIQNNLCNKILLLVNRARGQKILAAPELRISLSCIENVDKHVAITKGMREALIEKNRENMEECKKTKNLRTDLKKHREKIGKDIHQIYSYINLLRRVNERCSEVLINFNMNSTGSEEITEEIVSALCNKKLLATYQSSSYLVSLIRNNENMQQIKAAYEKNIPQMVESKLNGLAQNLQQLKVNFKKATEEETDMIQILAALKTVALNLQEKLAAKVKELSNLENTRQHVYNGKKHDDAITKYHALDTGRVEGFDLALNALDHEVESCFAGEKITEKDRLSATKALKLCLQREKKRCQRELSEINLPVFCKRAEILEALKKHDAVIVVAQTGSGKSTQVPQYLADDLHHALSRSYLLNKFPKIACTQPRRVACQRIADRVSQEYAGAVDMPKTTDDGESQMKKEKSDIKRVSAYPLYAKLSNCEQDRALNIDDRVGFDEIYKTKTKKENLKKDLSGTPGELGEWVGFQIGSKGKTSEERKNAKKFSKETRIHFVTEGLLLQKLKNTSNETSYNCIIIDEAHERGRDTDLLLAHLRAILKTTKDETYKGNNVKVVIMSASIDQKVFSDYFDGCPIVECKGRMFDVSINYLPPPSAPSDYEKINESGSDCIGVSDSDYDSTWERNSNTGSTISETSINLPKVQTPKQKKQSEMDVMIKHAVDAVFDHVLPHETPGDALVFLPGQGEIDLCVDMINKRARKESKNHNQFYSTRKVVCCTNIAETSLTIPGVTFVLDAGKAKKIQYNNVLRVSSLRLKDISKASAKQRQGRAGRVEEGHCIRLYSEEHFEDMEAFDEPEMKQMPIDELYLYSLDLFGGLEHIDLMEDACPERESIYNARKRLTNLGYVQEDENEVKISPDGTFALSLTGQVSLEGSKMILESKKYEIVDDALALAVVMEENIFTERENKERLKYFDELGDHLTVFNIYKHFTNKIENSQGSNERRSEIAKSWCEELGINFGILQQISKSISTIYETIKKERKCGVADMFKKKLKKENNEQKKKNKRRAEKKNEEAESLVKNRESLMKLIISGYFHNIGVLNDPKYIKSGYSVITPRNYGDTIFRSEEADLLKVTLSRDSSLMLLGDVTENAAVIFRTLFEPVDGLVLMHTSSKIKPEWIAECASKRWKDSIGLSICNSGVIKSYVERERYQFIGPSVLAKLLKLEDSNKKRFLKLLEKKTNAKIMLLFETGELKMYGSKKEINLVQPQLLSRVKEIKLELYKEDTMEKYPKPEGDKQEICIFDTGLVVSRISKPRPEIITDWNQIQSGTLILHKDVKSEKHIKNVLMSLQSKLSPKLRILFEEPNVFMKGKELAIIRFKRYDIAIAFESILNERLANHFSNSTKCFIDKEVQFQVIKTSLYPSVHSISKKYSSLIVAEPSSRGELFRVKLVKKSPRSANLQIDEFIGELREQYLFGSELIEELNDLPPGVKEYIYWKVEKKIEKKNLEIENNVVIKKRKEPIMVFEIFGELNNRRGVAKTIRTKIQKLKYDIENNVNKYTRTFNRKISMPSRNIIGPVILNINKLRTEHQNLKISILLDGADGNKSMPVVHLLCDSAADGLKAVDDIKQCFEICVKGNEEQICFICNNEVRLRKSSKQKKKERQELKEARQENRSTVEKHIRLKEEGNESLVDGYRLVICGCTYCKQCFKRIVKKQLNKQTDAVEHKRISCVQCKQVILMKDINYSGIGEHWRNNIYELALQNYLLINIHGSGGGRIDKCGRCRSLMVLYSSDSVLYRCHNDKCRFIFCCGCGKRFMGNKPDFEAHKQCRMTTRAMNQRRNPGKCITQPRPEYYYNGDYY